ncbi:hypothetical protein COY07_04590 [Candidatus Peregrinibacteria bacterium CG_4_10_14_0_2_um_filter_43_11]|nr:MAG: hypothetical protein COY07_04590 [Candidatus Peregrinibacteria bacterium CG_4_10_14_0_2_um_filter_43_11]
MKKLLSFALLILFFAYAPLSMRAQEPTPSFFEAWEQLGKLESYAMQQTFSGNIQFTGDSAVNEAISADFRINMSSRIKNKAIFESDSATEINGYLEVKYKSDGKNKPFDRVIANFQAQVVYLYNDGIYLKLDGVGIKTEGISNTEQKDYEQFQIKLNKAASEFKGKWLYLPMDDLKALSENAGSDTLTNQDLIIQQLKEEGLKATYKALLKSEIQKRIEEGEFTEDQAKMIEGFTNAIFDTEFFHAKVITEGNNKGFTAFKTNKSAIIKLARFISDKMGVNASQRDLIKIRNILNKFTLSGMYHIDDTHRIYDHLSLRFWMSNLEPMDRLEVSYRYKVSRINAAGDITKPTEFESILESDLLPMIQE